MSSRQEVKVEHKVSVAAFTSRDVKWVGEGTFTFTFMHLADAFIQSDLHCIQVTVFHILSALYFISSLSGKRGGYYRGKKGGGKGV